jgi:glycosyltransferase involved in cell wall biosynthesis
MKLLFVYRFCGLGGVETSVLSKLDALRPVGVEARVLFSEYYGSGGSTLAEDPRVTVSNQPERIRELLRAGFDVVSVIDYPEFLEQITRADILSRIIVETHASSPQALRAFYRNLDHPRIAAVVVPAMFNKQLVEASLKTVKPVVVIPNPVGEHFRPHAMSPQFPVSLTAEGPILLWIGRMENEKNPIEFIRIAKIVLKSRPDVRPLMIGDAYGPAEYTAYLERLQADIPDQWAERFTFYRSAPHHDMPAVYAAAADSGGCLVSTSLFESAPMTFIEAMSCNCPVVSTNVGGVAGAVKDGITGHLYELGDVTAAVSKIRTLIDVEQQHIREDIVARASAEVAERNSPKAVAQAYLNLMGSLKGRPTGNMPNETTPSETSLDTTIIPGLVTTIIPVYNRATLLREAVDSVLAQTYRKIEVIIVDDGSTDDTATVCDELARAHPVIRVIHKRHEGRAGLAREAGRRTARGEYIQYLDSDDLLMPTKFAEMVAGLRENPDCDIAYCYTRKYRIGSVPPESPAELTGQTFERMLPAFLSRRYWCTSTPLYRRSLCDKAGAWSDLPFWEDIEYDIRIATHDPRLWHCKSWLTEMRDHDFGRLSSIYILESPSVLSQIVRGTRMIYQHIKSVGLTYDDEHVRSFIDDVRVMHDACKELSLSEEAQQTAAIVMDATGVMDPKKVGDYSVKAVVEPQVSVLKAHPADHIRCPVRVVNHSTVDFHCGELTTKLGYRLLNTSGRVIQFDGLSVIFEQPLHPGESRVVDLWVQAPSEYGLYYVEVDVLWARRNWINFGSNSAAFVKLFVCERFSMREWRLSVEGDNAAILEFPEGQIGVVRLAIQAASTKVRWHVQLNNEWLSVSANQRYELRFRARADAPRSIAVAVSKAHDPWDSLGLYREIQLVPDWQNFTFGFVASATDDKARIHFDAGGTAVSVELGDVALNIVPSGEPVVSLPLSASGRLQMDVGVQPASYLWGTDRGLPVHRYYLDLFLAEFASDIRGHCLEFQDPQYAPRFGGASVTKLDILHVDETNPEATIVADLTRPNQLPDSLFDCIVCTHVLHMILDVQTAISEMFRILKPGGTLLIAVPQVSMYGPEYGEVWRFTPHGLETLLLNVFSPANVVVRPYGNSLTAAGEIRGVVSSEFLTSELNTHDARFAVEVCARAVK